MADSFQPYHSVPPPARNSMQGPRNATPVPTTLPTVVAGDVSAIRGCDVAIVLPTLNEQDGLVRTLADIPYDALLTTGRRVVRVVIDGGSTDRTVEVAREHGLHVLRQTTPGKGAAIREALTWLAGEQVQYAVILDADFTYPGTAVPAVVELLEAGSQLVVGVREPDTSPKEDLRELVHRIGNRLLNIAASQLSGLPFLDLCSGFWGVDLEAMEPLQLASTGFEIEAELFTKAYRAGYAVTQIPISYRERIGTAKLHAIRDGAKILLTSIRYGRRDLRSAFSSPSPSQFRDLLTLAMIAGGKEFVVMADDSRRSEAEEIVRRIHAGRPSLHYRILTLPAGSVRGPHRVDVAVDPDSLPTGSITIFLPRRDTPDAGTSTYAFVHLPRTDRLVALRSGTEDLSDPAYLARSGGFSVGPEGLHVEFSSDKTSQVIERPRAVYANTFPDARAKELAFLGANGHYGRLVVLRPRGGAKVVPHWAYGESPLGRSGPEAVLAEGSVP